MYDADKMKDLEARIRIVEAWIEEFDAGMEAAEEEIRQLISVDCLDMFRDKRRDN